MPDDAIVATLRLEYSSNLVAGAQRDEVALRGMSSQAEAMGVKARAAGTAAQASSVSLETAARKVSTLGLVVGGAAGALDIFASKSTADFNAKLLLIQTQAGASASEMEHMKQSVLALSGEVAQTPTALADALFHLESAGYRGSAALDALRVSAQLADIGHANLEDTTNALIALTESRIKGIRDENDAASQLNATVGASNTRLEALVGAMSTGILPAAKAVGLSFLDVGSALAVMTTKGVPAQEAATRLRMEFALMEAPSAKAQKALASIGITSTQLADDMRNKGLLFALQDLQKHLEDSGKTATQQAQIIYGAFGGARSGSTILTLLQSLDMLKQKYQDIAAGASKFGDAFKQTQKEVDYEWAQLGATVQRTAIEMGQAFAPITKLLIAGLQDTTSAVEHLEQISPGLVTGLSAVALGIGGISLALKAGMSLWAPYNAVIQFVASRTAASAVATTAAAGAQTAMAGSTALVDAAMTKWAASLLTTDELIAALDTELAVTGPEAVAAGAGMETAAAGAGLLAGAVDLLMGPVGIVALGVAIGVIAYEKSPAFRSEINLLASHLGNDVKGASDIATDALTKFGDKLNDITAATNDWVATLKQGLGLGPQSQGDRTSWQDALIGGFQAMNPLLAGADALLQHVNSDQEIAAAKAAKAAAALRDQAAALREVKKGANDLYAGLSSLQGPNFGGLLQSGPGVAGPAAFANDPVKKSATDLAKDLDALRLALQKALNEAVARKYFDVQAGAPASVISADTAAVRLAERNLADFNKATSTSTVAHQKHVKAIDQLTTDLEGIRSRLTTALNDAVARLVLDERKGASTATITADQSRVDSAKKSLDAFTKQINDATASVKANPVLSPSQQQGKELAAKTSARDDAEAVVAADIRKHGQAWLQDSDVGRAHVNTLTAAQHGLDQYNKSVSEADRLAKEKLKKPLDALQEQDKTRASKQHDFDEAVAVGAADLRAGHPITVAHQQAIDRAKSSLDRYDKSINDAQHSTDLANQAVRTFADILKDLADTLASKADDLATLDYRGTAGQAIPGAGRTVDDNGNVIRSTVTRGQKAEGDIYTAAAAKEKADLANAAAARVSTDAQIRAARSAGDLSRAFDLISQTDTTNLNNAWTAIQEHFITGDGDLAALIESWKAAKAAQDKDTQATIDAANATRQYATAVSARQKQASDSQADAVGLLTEKYHDHVAVTQADIDAGIAARHATEAWTQSQWDANFATASLAQQQNMLVARFSGMVSIASGQQSGLNNVAAAKLTVLADQGALEIDSLKAMVTAEDDQTSIMQAESAVAKAEGAGQVSAINDATSILQSGESVWKDMQDIAHATSPQTLAVARAQLVVDQVAMQENRDKAAADRADSAEQVKIASDGVVLAKDKAAADKQTADSQYKLDQDRLKTAVDTEKLTEDTVKLDGLMAQSLDILASSLAGVDSAQGDIQNVLDSIAADNAGIRADNAQMQTDQLAADRQQQALQLQIASDGQQLSVDQQASDATTLAGQTRIAQDGYALETAKFQLQQAQYAAQSTTSANTSQTNALLQKQLDEAASLNQDLLNEIALLRKGSTFNFSGGPGGPFVPWLNRANAEAGANGG